MAATVTIEQLHTSLDSWLMKIRAGESVVIMEQGRVLATVSPVQPISANYFEIGRQAIQRLAAKGQARPGSGKPVGNAAVSITAYHAPLAEAVVEEREEGM
ncbi:MAG: hypothetical protein GY862_28720 [Gammaproteobacteria bacterium]|nr:hypothetical protein [Gammaproteobacteria bacterium]